jgi:hypothetical protein
MYDTDLTEQTSTFCGVASGWLSANLDPEDTTSPERRYINIPFPIVSSHSSITNQTILAFERTSTYLDSIYDVSCFVHHPGHRKHAYRDQERHNDSVHDHYNQFPSSGQDFLYFRDKCVAYESQDKRPHRNLHRKW